eukprot:7294177-Alexandrium_andersonii.AAC.1
MQGRYVDPGVAEATRVLSRVPEPTPESLTDLDPVQWSLGVEKTWATTYNLVRRRARKQASVDTCFTLNGLANHGKPYLRVERNWAVGVLAARSAQLQDRCLIVSVASRAPSP